MRNLFRVEVALSNQNVDYFATRLRRCRTDSLLLLSLGSGYLVRSLSFFRLSGLQVLLGLLLIGLGIPGSLRRILTFFLRLP